MAAQELSIEELGKASRLANRPKGEQYDRMVSGMLYDSFVPELLNARFKARRWCHTYNSYFPNDPEADDASLSKERLAMLKKSLGGIGDDEIYIEAPFRVDYGCNVTVGSRFYANFNLTILDSAIVTIGDRVMIGPNVSIFTATHEAEVKSRRENIEFAKPVTIGTDVWIGGHAVIMPGVVIGDGCIIGAGSIVIRDVPAWSMAVGVPAKVVRKLTQVDVQDGDRVIQ